MLRTRTRKGETKLDGGIPAGEALLQGVFWHRGMFKLYIFGVDWRSPIHRLALALALVSIGGTCLATSPSIPRESSAVGHASNPWWKYLMGRNDPGPCCRTCNVVPTFGSVPQLAGAARTFVCSFPTFIFIQAPSLASPFGSQPSLLSDLCTTARILKTLQIPSAKADNFSRRSIAQLMHGHIHDAPPVS